MKKVVVIGGGTGSFTVLSGLKKKNLDITTIVPATDSGGSSGILRDEFGLLPMGDLRMALVALADSNGDGDILRELFMYRFENGHALAGHNFGNLFLTALTDIFKNQQKAFEYASKILRVKGKVIPICEDNVTLVAQYENGEMIVGETHIDEPHLRHDGLQKIVNLSIQPKARISKRAKEAILNADLIVLGPGDLYTSILANIVVGGAAEVIKKSSAKILFVVNLINKYGQTSQFKVSDYISELRKYLKKDLDYVLINSQKLPRDILKKYEKEKGFPVLDDLKKSAKYKIIRRKLISPKIIKKHSGDSVKRSLIRHDPQKLAEAIMNVC